MADGDRIFALATAPGRAGVAVVRVSGPSCREDLRDLIGTVPPAGRGVRALRDGSGVLLDEALVLTFAAGASFTGEEVVELHLHGSLAVVAAVLENLRGREGFRLAEAGEFTRRAMENGRLDLAQVEGLGDLIDAETEVQRRQALRVLSGDVGTRVEGWRSRLLRAAALTEATIDFADEEVPEDVWPEVRQLLTDLRDDLMREAEGARIAERVRAGFEVAIMGPPNIGKSTLLNRLAGRSAAITSEVAGTTRDVIEVRMDIAGVPVTLLDTAGLRESDDQIERLGIELARSRGEQADIRVYLLGPDDVPPGLVQRGDILLQGKADLEGREGPGVSGLTGAGVDELLNRLADELRLRVSEVGTVTRFRHAEALRLAVASVDEALDGLTSGDDGEEVLADRLRHAARALDRVVGRLDIEDILGEIFSSFCIGK